MTRSTEWRHRLPAVVAVLLMVGAVLVIVGVAIERAGEDRAQATESTHNSIHSESGKAEPTEESAEEHADEAHREESARPGAEAEDVLGVPVESTAALAALAVVSSGLAVLVWRRPSRPVAAAVIAFAVGAGAFDTTETGRQLSGDRTGLAVLATAIALLRVATLARPAVVWRDASPRRTRPG